MYEAVVVDASPLIILSRAGLVDLLECLDCPLFVPREVSIEVEEKGARDVIVLTIRQAPYLQPALVGDIPPSIAAWNLGAGESAVLTWAHKHPGTLAVLDDKMGRRCAEVFLAAVGHVAKARGMSAIAKSAGLGRESLYKAFAPGSKPRYETVRKVLQGLGVRLTIVAA